MKKPSCPACTQKSPLSNHRLAIVKAGFFRRTSDSKKVQRFRCKNCKANFSWASSNPCFRQRKRLSNHKLKLLLASGVSQRRCAKLLHLSRSTVKAKFIFLGEQALALFNEKNKTYAPSQIVEFDDLETFEHTKCKPLSVTLMVESGTRRILGFEVSKMPAKGHLAKIAYKKYGPRKDERALGRERLFTKTKSLIHPEAVIKSDQNPHYVFDVQRHFPKAQHIGFKGQRGSNTGQGELKKVKFDPIFSLNHTCAMFRANMNRLFRKTWCTTKVADRLRYHIAIYAVYHNFTLIESS